MDDKLRERLEEVVVTFGEVEMQLADPVLLANVSEYTKLAKRHSDLKTIVATFQAYQAVEQDAIEAAELSQLEDDEEMKAEFAEMASNKIAEAEKMEAGLWLALAPKDPNDDRDVLLEIRAGVGGDEAALWASDMLKMYDSYAESLGFKTSVVEGTNSEAGGYRSVTVSVKGAGAFSKLKYEAGVHRVQRVPKTESQGRVHTSTATVAVLPEADEIEFELDPNDVRVDVYRASGPGGQSVNTTDSAVRLTHEPTGTVVSCQDEKSQLQNKEKAFRILRARLYADIVAAEHEKMAAARLSQVGSGGRSEKIRTYNYKDSRVTDHRIGLTIKQLQQVLDGMLEPFVERLAAEEMAARLTEG
jgi:peptide chain release factor 1